MAKGEYRIFSNGKVLLSIWASERLVKTVTTNFVLEENIIEMEEIEPIQSTMSLAAALAMKSIPRDDLQKLSQRLDLPISECL